MPDPRTTGHAPARLRCAGDGSQNRCLSHKRPAAKCAPEKAEQGPQLVINHQGVTLTAACGSQQDRFIDQGILMDQVKKVLEHAGVRAPKDRGNHYQNICLLHFLQRLLHHTWHLSAPCRAHNCGTSVPRTVNRGSTGSFWAIKCSKCSARTVDLELCCTPPEIATTRNGRMMALS